MRYHVPTLAADHTMANHDPNISVRSATINANDVEAIAALKKAWNVESWGDHLPNGVLVSPEQALRRLQAAAGSEETYLAEVNGSPVGLASIRFSPSLDEDAPYAEVTQLFVAAEQRRTGVATRLMSHVESIARSRGCTSIHLITGSSNAAAQAFYQVAGYEALYLGFEKFLKPIR